jgi:hypothetical protein
MINWCANTKPFIPRTNNAFLLFFFFFVVLGFELRVLCLQSCALPLVLHLHPYNDLLKHISMFANILFHVFHLYPKISCTFNFISCIDLSSGFGMKILSTLYIWLESVSSVSIYFGSITCKMVFLKMFLFTA